VAPTSTTNKPYLQRLMICEGVEDCCFFKRLIEARALPRFYVYHSGIKRGSPGGETRFSAGLREFSVHYTKQYRQLKDILIVADNDNDPPAKFKNVQTQIDEFFGNGTAPAAPLVRVKKHPNPAITIMMIPWTNINGAIETLCAHPARKADDNAAKKTLECLDSCHADKWGNDLRLAKAWLRVNLAIRSTLDPDVPIGDALMENKHKYLFDFGDQNKGNSHPELVRIEDELNKFKDP